MARIIMSGCCGKMGRVIANEVKKRPDCEIVAGLDINKDGILGFPIFQYAEDINVDADVVIDFSNPSALSSLLIYCIEKKLPVIICTTGYSDVQIEQIKEAAHVIPVFYSGNMSLGINLIIELAKRAATVFGDSFDIEIVEKHHNQKIDAPSGTALMIADGISSVMDSAPEYVYDRHSYRRARSKNEIGIHSIRGGSIVGEHEVIFAGHDEVLTISHLAQSKEIFAVGAINAAMFMVGKSEGMYNMSDLLGNR